LSITVQKPRAQLEQEAVAKIEKAANKAMTGKLSPPTALKTSATTESTNQSPPKDHTKIAGPIGIIHLDDDKRSKTSDATVKERNINSSQAGTSTTSKPAAKVPGCSADKVFMDLRIRVEADEDVMGAMDKAIARVKGWYLDMLRVQPNFRLHTVNPDSKTLTQLDDPLKFPSKLPDCKDFFAGLRPLTRGGNLELKVLASSKRGMKKDAKESKFYHHALKENFKVSPIQWHSRKLSNWLLYSTRQTGWKKLGKDLTGQIGIEVSCRFIRINDRSPYDREVHYARKQMKVLMNNNCVLVIRFNVK
jgi:hypothetical protein